MPVLAWQRSRATLRRMRCSSVPLRPATASEVSKAGPASSPSAMCWSSRTTWRGVVRLERERPEPSATRGRRPKPVIVRRTTAAPARVVPPVPNCCPSALISVSALKLSDGRLVRRAISAIVAERCSASGSAPASVRPVRAEPPMTTSRRLSARSKARAAYSGGRFCQ